MAARASWTGTLKIAEVACPVSLYAAASTSDRIVFHTINRATGNRVRREFIDSETGKPVDRDDQVKGYELAEGEHVVLTPEELDSAVPEGAKVLAVSTFVPCGKVDTVFFDKPYYLAPANAAAAEAFGLIRDGLREKEVVAMAEAVLFRRQRTLLIRPLGRGLVGTTLNFDYEVRPVEAVFEEVPEFAIQDEMLELARHIIATKMGRFDLRTFDDRYEAALAEVVKAKIDGRKVTPPATPRREAPADLLAALRQSAKLSGKGKAGAEKRKAAPTRRKAG